LVVKTEGTIRRSAIVIIFFFLLLFLFSTLEFHLFESLALIQIDKHGDVRCPSSSNNPPNPILSNLFTFSFLPIHPSLTHTRTHAHAHPNTFSVTPSRQKPVSHTFLSVSELETLRGKALGYSGPTTQALIKEKKHELKARSDTRVKHWGNTIEALRVHQERRHQEEFDEREVSVNPFVLDGRNDQHSFTLGWNPVPSRLQLTIKCFLFGLQLNRWFSWNKEDWMLKRREFAKKKGKGFLARRNERN
jgi:hypothetical protein